MALKPCRECGAQVSTEAEVCAHCGVRFPAASISFVGPMASNPLENIERVPWKRWLPFMVFMIGFIGLLGLVALSEGFEFVGKNWSGFLILYFLPWIYFAPTMNAWNRNHRNTNAIAVLNLFLGWTFIGWVIALVWSNAD